AVSVGARHAVPGKRTWQNRTICLSFRWPFFLRSVISSDANTRKHMPGGWRAIAFGAFGHGMPCPYCTNCSRATIGCQHVRKFNSSAPTHDSLSELRLFASGVLLRDCLCEGEAVHLRRSHWRGNAVE